jgi:hypothetical protein
MLWFLTIALFPPLVHELWRRDLPLGWLLWVVTFPVLVRAFERQKKGTFLFLIFACGALLHLHLTNALRFLVQIVFPAYLAGRFLLKRDLRLRDTLWLSSLGLIASVGIGLIFGMGDRLRDVIVPAGIPTGWISPLLLKGESWLHSLFPDSTLYARALSFFGDVEPVVWSALLFVLMGMGMGIALFLWDPGALSLRGHRDSIFDIALGILCLSLGVATLTHGFLSLLASEIAFTMLVFFLLEGIEFLLWLLKHLPVKHWISFCGLVVIFHQPLTLFFLPFMGVASGFFQGKREGGVSSL